MKKYILTALTALVLGTVILNAIPAHPGWIKYTQPDGTVMQIHKVGDEFGHYTINKAGQYVEMDEDGFYRPVDAATVQARITRAAARRQTAIQRRRAGDHIALGQKHFLVILVEFKDKTFSSATAHEDFVNLLNKIGYDANGATGSARDFYYENSHGVFEPIFDVYGPVKLSKNYSYYGANDNSGNDKYPEEAVVSACSALNSEIDFSQYDQDQDGYVDLVFMYYAGYGEADSDDENSIWPHQWEIPTSKTVTLDGVTLSSYACTNEVKGTYSQYPGTMCGIGTACHEFGHAMGLPDFYDTDYDTNGYAAAMFDFSTMDTGAYNNDGRTPPYLTTEERILLGWFTEEEAFREFTRTATITLPSVDENIAYRTFTDKEGEYFVYECRGGKGWDAYLAAPGLVVTHVDKSNRSVKYSSGSSTTTAYNLWANWGAYNAINENGNHPCCYVVPAVDQDNLFFGYEYINYYDSYYFDPYGKGYALQIPFPCRDDNNQLVNSYIAKSWNGVESEISLSDISYANSQVTFNVTVPSYDVDYNVIANPGNGVYTAGSRFSFELVESTVRIPDTVVWYYDDEPVQADSVTLTAGSHTVEAHITLTTGLTKIVTLEIQVN